MSRSQWNRIKVAKLFYAMVYRKMLTIIMVSQLINVILFLGIIYSFMNQPERAFYATSGIALPIRLTPMDSPNALPTALLPPDPTSAEGNKVMPE